MPWEPKGTGQTEGEEVSFSYTLVFAAKIFLPNDSLVADSATKTKDSP
jgi:hypothetical protein